MASGPEVCRRVARAVPPATSGQRDEHFHLVVVDGAQQPARAQPQRRAQRQPAHRFAQKDAQGVAQRDIAGAQQGHFQRHHKQHHAHAVVEQ